MSGSFKRTEIYDEIIEFINTNKNKKRIISFISDFNDENANNHYVEKLLNAFKNKNVIFDEYYIIDNRYKQNEIIDIINKSNILFILGGDTLNQINNIKKNSLIEYICDENKLIIGMSAGAINMAKRVVLAKDLEDNIPELSIYDGIGITNINIEPQCDFNNKTHWSDLLEASFKTKLIVMHDDSYIIINGEDINYYGHYLVLEKGIIKYKKKKCELNEFLKDI